MITYDGTVRHPLEVELPVETESSSRIPVPMSRISLL